MSFREDMQARNLIGSVFGRCLVMIGWCTPTLRVMPIFATCTAKADVNFRVTAAWKELVAYAFGGLIDQRLPTRAPCIEFGKGSICGYNFLFSSGIGSHSRKFDFSFYTIISPLVIYFFYWRLLSTKMQLFLNVGVNISRPTYISIFNFLFLHNIVTICWLLYKIGSRTIQGFIPSHDLALSLFHHIVHNIYMRPC